MYLGLGVANLYRLKVPGADSRSGKYLFSRYLRNRWPDSRETLGIEPDFREDHARRVLSYYCEQRGTIQLQVSPLIHCSVADLDVDPDATSYFDEDPYPDMTLILNFF